MRIGIVTTVLSNNYGGILQNYALQTVLKRFGHEVITLGYTTSVPLSSRILSLCKRLLLFISGKHVRIKGWPSKRQQAIINSNTQRFINRYIEELKMYKLREIAKYESNGFDAVVVGSDQVWRGTGKNILPLFLQGFNDTQIRISYAASFGIDKWQFDAQTTIAIRESLARFKAISVREVSAIKLIRENLDLEAKQVLDPTMLLCKEDYCSIIGPEMPKDQVMVYILDNSEFKSNVINLAANHFSYRVIEVMPKHYFGSYPCPVEDCVFPPVEEWLKGFRDSKFVVTDSFHGTVFSIIFNKPFVTINNAVRGSARFHSLLSLFGLERRLVSSIGQAKEIISEPIDFNKVNRIIESKREDALDFIKTNLPS